TLGSAQRRALELRERRRGKAMLSLRSIGRHWAPRAMPPRLTPPLARGRMAALISVIVLLTGEIPLCAQTRTATASLTVQVRPEELLQVQNGSVALKVRLASGATARLWAAN